MSATGEAIGRARPEGRVVARLPRGRHVRLRKSNRAKEAEA